MPQILIGGHATLGEVGALMFLWVLVELLNPTTERLHRARPVHVVIGSAIVGGVIIFLFYVWHFFA